MKLFVAFFSFVRFVIFVSSAFTLTDAASAKDMSRFELHVDNKLVLQSEDIESAKAEKCDQAWCVTLQLKNSSFKKLQSLTHKNIGKIMDIIIDQKVRSSPTIHQEIKSRNFIVDAGFSETEAKNIALEFSKKNQPNNKKSN